MDDLYSRIGANYKVEAIARYALRNPWIFMINSKPIMLLAAYDEINTLPPGGSDGEIALNALAAVKRLASEAGVYFRGVETPHIMRRVVRGIWMSADDAERLTYRKAIKK